MQDKGESYKKPASQTKSPPNSPEKKPPPIKANVDAPPPAPKPDKQVAAAPTNALPAATPPSTINVTLDVGGKEHNLDFGIPLAVETLPSPPPPTQEAPTDFPSPPPVVESKLPEEVPPVVPPPPQEFQEKVTISEPPSSVQSTEESLPPPPPSVSCYGFAKWNKIYISTCSIMMPYSSTVWDYVASQITGHHSSAQLEFRAYAFNSGAISH